MIGVSVRVLPTLSAADALAAPTDLALLLRRGRGQADENSVRDGGEDHEQQPLAARGHLRSLSGSMTSPELDLFASPEVVPGTLLVSPALGRLLGVMLMQATTSGGGAGEESAEKMQTPTTKQWRLFSSQSMSLFSDTLPRAHTLLLAATEDACFVNDVEERLCSVRLLPLLNRILKRRPICDGMWIALPLGDREVTLRVKQAIPEKQNADDPTAKQRRQTVEKAGNEDKHRWMALSAETVLHFDLGGRDDSDLRSLFPWPLVSRIRDLIDQSQKKTAILREIGMSLPKGVVISGSAGIGKSFLTRMLARTSRVPFYRIHPPAFGSYASDIACVKAIKQTFASASSVADSIAVVVIEHLDLWNRGSDSSKPDPQECLIGEINCAVASSTTFLIGVCREFSKVPSDLKSFFSEEVNIPLPDRKLRQGILRHYLSRGSERGRGTHSNRQSGTSQEKIGPYFRYPDQHDPIWSRLDDLSALTAGFTPAELKRVCTRILLAWNDRTVSAVDYSERGDQADSLAVIERGLATLAIDRKAMPSISWESDVQQVVMEMPQQEGPGEFMNIGSLTVRWEDIAGYTHVKDALRKLVEWPLLRSKEFKRLGLPARSGLLLHGPSGCGKSILAHAAGLEFGVPVFSVKGGDFFSKYLGETERFVRSLFARARQSAPCILILDELDAIGAKREWDEESGNDVNERVLSQLLNEMDGIEDRAAVFIIGCTNTPDRLDDALVRPGRLDQHLLVDYPSAEDRSAILSSMAQRTALAPDVNVSLLVAETAGMTCADLVALFRDAAMEAMRRSLEADMVLLQDIKAALSQRRFPSSVTFSPGTL